MKVQVEAEPVLVVAVAGSVATSLLIQQLAETSPIVVVEAGEVLPTFGVGLAEPGFGLEVELQLVPVLELEIEQ